MLLAELGSEVLRRIAFVDHNSLLFICAQIYVDKEKRWVFFLLILLFLLLLLGSRTLISAQLVWILLLNSFNRLLCRL